MRATDEGLSTGIADLDRVLRGVNAGDNIVWEIEDVEDYALLARPFATRVAAEGRRMVYLHYAPGPALLEGPGIQRHDLDPAPGFEPFLDRVHEIIRGEGRGASYVLDCLSDIRADWYTDGMLGNLFLLTCPYLYDLETVTYFALRWGRHAASARKLILETTQLYLEVHRAGDGRYIRPVKVQHRYTSTMHHLHRWRGNTVTLVSSSAEVSRVLSRSPRAWTPTASEAAPARTFLTRDPALLEMADRWLGPDDLLAVRRRMIGGGLVGGKAAGLVLSRGILRRTHPDVYLTFLVSNGVWWLRQRQRDPEGYLEGAEQARRRILTGAFPDEIMQGLEAVLDYFGQAPYVVRSSSLLEDGFGSAFAGKYESVFCATQGPRERRMADFLAAARTVYASAMGERALRYRAERGLLESDEAMALLVMRVSGTLQGRSYYPAVAGVAYSYNPFAWSREIESAAGVARLVLGLGTRAVNRVDDDYARLVALNAPLRRPETAFDQVSRVSQRKVDYLDLDANRVVSGHFLDLTREAGDLPLELLITREGGFEGTGEPRRALTLDGLLSRTSFVPNLRTILGELERAYGGPVDIELTANFEPDGAPRLNVLQCRRLHVRSDAGDVPEAADVPEADRLLDSAAAVVGHSRRVSVDCLVLVVPEAYAALPHAARPQVAALVGRLNRVWGRAAPGVVVLAGPGRWGTSSPELGVPIAFNDISRVAAILEIVAMREDLVPDVSLGTHFLNDLVEQDMLYAAVPPQEMRGLESFLVSSPNRLVEIVPDAAEWAGVIRVVDTRDSLAAGVRLWLSADARGQRLLIYRR